MHHTKRFLQQKAGELSCDQRDPLFKDLTQQVEQMGYDGIGQEHAHTYPTPHREIQEGNLSRPDD